LSKVLITGGNGFVGSHVADRLLARGNFVRLLDLNFDWHSADSSAERVVCDVLDYNGLRRAAESVDAILHLAAVSRVEDAERDPERCIRVNVGGTMNVIRVARETSKALVFASSREVYGDAEALPVNEETPKRPLSAYARSKLAAENLLAEAGMTEGLRYTIVRLSNVFGSPRDRRERVVPTFVRQALAGQPLTIHGGAQCMDFTFIDDVADAVASIAENPDRSTGEDYNVVSGRSHTVIELARMVRRYTRSKSEFTFEEPRAYYAGRFIASAAKIDALAERQNSVRGLDEGLPLCIDRVAGPRMMEVVHD
jgi:nucleoside-diphosphate-sugar epimerase